MAGRALLGSNQRKNKFVPFCSEYCSIFNTLQFTSLFFGKYNIMFLIKHNIWTCFDAVRQCTLYIILNRKTVLYSIPYIHRYFYVHCTLYYTHSTLYVLHNVQCTLNTVHYTMYTVHCTLYTVHCTLFTVHCTVYTSYRVQNLRQSNVKKPGIRTRFYKWVKTIF